MTASETNRKADFPMTPAVFHILLSIADEERHGYGIMQEVAQRTGGEVKLGPGTLYRSIKRMHAAGLISAVADPEGTPGDDERRRFYRITELGQLAVEEEARRLANLVSQAHTKRVLDHPHRA